MNILFLHQSPCIRAYREGYALKNNASDIKLFLIYQGKSLNQKYGFGDEIFDKMIKLPPGNLWFYIKNRNKLYDLIEKLDIDIIHAHNFPDTFAFTAIKYKKKPVIYDIHDMYSLFDYKEMMFSSPKTAFANMVTFGLYPHTIFKFFEKYCIRNANAIIVVSEYMKKEVEKYRGQDKNIFVMPNFILDKDLRNLEPKKDSIKKSRLKIVFEGSLGAPKTAGDLTDTINSLGCIKNIELHIYGFSWKQAYIDYHMESIKKYDNVFFHGKVTPDELLALLPQYDCGIVPDYKSKTTRHLHSQMPNKLFEYLAAGLPILSGNFFSLKHFITENKIGCIYNNLDDGIIQAVEEIENNYSLYYQNVLDIRKKYTWENHIPNVIILYRELMKGNYNIK
ncbi:MAG: glycosyltransferase [Candidatus Methanoperedens sp.]|nr:glycosyltransferase [Candidatus Methanoperedens sp.]